MVWSCSEADLSPNIVVPKADIFCPVFRSPLENLTISNQTCLNITCLVFRWLEYLKTVVVYLTFRDFVVKLFAVSIERNLYKVTCIIFTMYLPQISNLKEQSTSIRYLWYLLFNSTLYVTIVWLLLFKCGQFSKNKNTQGVKVIKVFYR